jgi:hypothetical protein
VGTRSNGLVAALVWLSGCGTVSTDIPDAPPDAPALGTEANPADSCTQVMVVVGPDSGVYWLRHPDGVSPPLEVYCEQELNQGGWVMLVNSVLTDGLTTGFWRLTYAQRHDRLGIAAADQNYYDGRLYHIGTDYMDVIVDLEGTAAIAALVTAAGVDPETMAFIEPNLVAGNADVYASHFAGGWASQDADYDHYVDNCAVFYERVAQHYSNCWAYNLGADADVPYLDDGVGPHVGGGVLSALGLAPEPAGGGYSRVNRIIRFTRW